MNGEVAMAKEVACHTFFVVEVLVCTIMCFAAHLESLSRAMMLSAVILLALLREA